MGLGGATGYLAVLSLAGVTAPIVAPVVLVLNVAVAGISFGHFYRAGFFRPRLLVPFLVTSIPASLAGGLIPLTRTVFVLVLGVTLLAAGLRLLFLPTVDRDGAHGLPGETYWLLSLGLGIVLGLLAGITGSGGGFLLIPVLLVVFRVDPRQAAAAAAGFVVLNSLAGFSGHLIRGHVDWAMTGSLLGVVVVGGYLGSRLGSFYWRAETVQRVIAVVLLIGGAKLLVDFLTLMA